MGGGDWRSRKLQTGRSGSLKMRCKEADPAPTSWEQRTNSWTSSDIYTVASMLRKHSTPTPTHTPNTNKQTNFKFFTHHNSLYLKLNLKFKSNIIYKMYPRRHFINILYLTSNIHKHVCIHTLFKFMHVHIIGKQKEEVRTLLKKALAWFWTLLY